MSSWHASGSGSSSCCSCSELESPVHGNIGKNASNNIWGAPQRCSYSSGTIYIYSGYVHIRVGGTLTGCGPRTANLLLPGGLSKDDPECNLCGLVVAWFSTGFVCVCVMWLDSRTAMFYLPQNSVTRRTLTQIRRQGDMADRYRIQRVYLWRTWGGTHTGKCSNGRIYPLKPLHRGK